MYAKHATEWLTLREGSTRRGTFLSPLFNVNERRPCALSDRIASAFCVYANADQSEKNTARYASRLRSDLHPPRFTRSDNRRDPHQRRSRRNADWLSCIRPQAEAASRIHVISWSENRVSPTSRVGSNNLAQIALVKWARYGGWEGGGGGENTGRFLTNNRRFNNTITWRQDDAEEGSISQYIAQPDTYGADFPHFIGSAVIVVDLLDVSLIAGGLDRPYAHLLFIIVVVALLLADERLVAVTWEIRRRLDNLLRGDCCRGCGFPCRGLRRELVLFCECSLFGLLSTSIGYDRSVANSRSHGMIDPRDFSLSTLEINSREYLFALAL